MIKYIKEESIIDYDATSQAQYTIDTITKYNKIHELENFLEEYFNNYNYIPTDEEVDDFLKYESDYIFKSLGILSI